MKINYEGWDEDFEDSSFVKLTKKAKIVHKEKNDTIRMKRKEKEKQRALQERKNSYEREQFQDCSFFLYERKINGFW